MGIYSINMGNGILISTTEFVKMFEKEFEDSVYQDGIEIAVDIIKRQFGGKYEISLLGHDALTSRDGDMDIFTDTVHHETFYQIKNQKKEKYEIPASLEEKTFFGCGDIFFIGVREEISANGGGEFEYYIKSSEVIYGLAVLLPSIVKLYPELQKVDVEPLRSTFHQNPCIWTFTDDCHCCG